MTTVLRTITMPSSLMSEEWDNSPHSNFLQLRYCKRQCLKVRVFRVTLRQRINYIWIKTHNIPIIQNHYNHYNLTLNRPTPHETTKLAVFLIQYSGVRNPNPNDLRLEL
ncbi:hypothetical protein Fmac_000504 [Flemingia macrophylla]|uniref:Uncharacterized protein n=1 Tax=Flemingia macrophylla TaxID=520843 RepID=A0ABD1NEG3_9FABA